MDDFINIIKNKKPEILKYLKIILAIGLLIVILNVYIVELARDKEYTCEANTVALPIWTKDKDGVLTYVNDAYERLILKPLGHTKEDLIGTVGDSVFNDTLFLNYRLNDSLVIAANKTLVFEEERFIGSGFSYKTPIFINGVLQGTSGIWIPHDKALLNK